MTRLDVRHAFADGLDNAGDLAAGREWPLRLELIAVLDDQRVGIIDAASGDGDQDLALACDRICNLLDCQRFGTADGAAEHGFHSVSARIR